MNDRQQALLDAARPLPIDLIIDLAGVCRKPGETDADLRARVQDGVRPIPMAIHTIQDAIAATEQGLASCYGRDGQGGDWVGFGRPRRTGHIPRVYLPASAAEVEGCQHVQRRYLRHKGETSTLMDKVNAALSDPDTREAQVEALATMATAGAVPANDAEHDGGIGPRGASAATVESEVRRACAAYPKIGALTFTDWRPVMGGRWQVKINGWERRIPASEYNAMRRKAEAIAQTFGENERDRRTCTTCQTMATVLCPCPVCGGVGS